MNVALGCGTFIDRIQMLMMIAQKQEQVIQLLGPANPLAPIDKYRNTLAQIVNEAGFKDDTRYFGQVDPGQMEQTLAQSQKPDPQTMLAQVEAQKVQASIIRENMKLQAEMQDNLRVDAREREKMRLDAMVRLADIEAKYGTNVNIAHIEAAIGHDQELAKAHIEAETQRHATAVNAMAQPQGTGNAIA